MNHSWMMVRRQIAVGHVRSPETTPKSARRIAEIGTKARHADGDYVKFRDMFPVSRRAALLMTLAGGMLTPLGAAEKSLAIRGYDPVAYFTLQRAMPGDARYAFDWDEQRWLFANVSHRNSFKADPARYAPQFASFCAVALARGEVQAANPEYWLISDGKLYLFGKPAGPGLFRDDAALREKARQNSALTRPDQRE